MTNVLTFLKIKISYHLRCGLHQHVGYASVVLITEFPISTDSYRRRDSTLLALGTSYHQDISENSVLFEEANCDKEGT